MQQPNTNQQALYPPGTNGMPMNMQPVAMQPGMQQGYVNQAMPGQVMPGQMINTNQTNENWMPMAQQIAGVPAGLEYLSQIDQLLVKQKIEVLELLSGMETNNKYKIKNSLGQQVFKAKEDSSFCSRQCCGPNRGFRMHITDNTGREVIELKRPFNCNMVCFPWCLHEMEVKAVVTGEILGKIKQNWNPCYPRFSIYDAADNKVFEINGPLCGCNCCADVNFKVNDLDGREVGLVQKQWTGLIKEAYTDSDNFGVTFPIDLDVKLKAVLLGAVFLVDFMYFEQPANNNN